MKEFLCVLICVMATMSANAQFTLTKDGFVSTEIPSNDYIVLNMGNVSKEELYLRTLKFITSHYKSAKNVTSKIDNEMITINAREPKIINCKNQKYDIDYTITISFKNGKIKIDSPVFSCSTFNYGRSFKLTMSGSNGGLGKDVTIGIFKKNGERGQKKTIEEIESFVNMFCENLKHDILDSSNNDW